MHFAKLQNVIYAQRFLADSRSLNTSFEPEDDDDAISFQLKKGQSSPCVSISINLARGVCACVWLRFGGWWFAEPRKSESQN